MVGFERLTRLLTPFIHSAGDQAPNRVCGGLTLTEGPIEGLARVKSEDDVDSDAADTGELAEAGEGRVGV